MAQSKHEIRAILSAAGAQPRHRFGQNFMIDQNLVRIVADAGVVAADDDAISIDLHERTDDKPPGRLLRVVHPGLS